MEVLPATQTNGVGYNMATQAHKSQQAELEHKKTECARYDWHATVVTRVICAQAANRSRLS